jgi:hypothetical protein
MQRVMMTSDFHACRTILLLSLTALLGGCAATLPPARPPTSIVPDITAADLKRAAQVAYDQGFAAGRRYQRKHDQEDAGAGQSEGAPPNAQASAPTGNAPICPPQTQAQQPAPVPIPPLPPSSSYTTSGPAQPLSQ